MARFGLSDEITQETRKFFARSYDVKSWIDRRAGGGVPKFVEQSRASAVVPSLLIRREGFDYVHAIDAHDWIDAPAFRLRHDWLSPFC